MQNALSGRSFANAVPDILWTKTLADPAICSVTGSDTGMLFVFMTQFRSLVHFSGIEILSQ
jgi:hypothetical protein